MTHFTLVSGCKITLGEPTLHSFKLRENATHSTTNLVSILNMNCSEFASDKRDLPQFLKDARSRSNDDKMFLKPLWVQISCHRSSSTLSENLYPTEPQYIMTSSSVYNRQGDNEIHCMRIQKHA